MGRVNQLWQDEQERRIEEMVAQGMTEEEACEKLAEEQEDRSPL